jgi:3-oxoacyl-[acyl-carrier protein] reductase
LSLRGRTAIVAGGGGAIGGAIATRLAEEGCDVALIDRQSTAGVVAAIEKIGCRVREFTADLTDTGQTRLAVTAATAWLNGLDILVNAAGITSPGSFAGLSELEWDRVMATNLKSVFVLCQSAIEPLKARGGGRIINIGSVLGKNGGNARPWLDPSEQDGSGNVAYGVSKAGVHAMTSYLSRELAAFGITVNAVAPGPIASAMTAAFPERLKALIPLGRLGRPAEVAATVAFLADDSAGFITGEIIDVNGGIWSD